jgi:hypothetical protein
MDDISVIDCEAVFRPHCPELRFLPEGPYDLGQKKSVGSAFNTGEMQLAVR